MKKKLKVMLIISFFLCGLPAYAEKTDMVEKDGTNVVTESTESSTVAESQVDESSSQMIVEEVNELQEPNKAEMREIVKQKNSEEYVAEDVKNELSVAVESGSISQKFVDSFTDQQLLNAWSYFVRFNEDIIGSDADTLARFLKEFYIDGTKDWDKIQKLMSFRPDVMSFQDLKSNLPQLREYMSGMYGFSLEYSDADLIEAIDYAESISADSLPTITVITSRLSENKTNQSTEPSTSISSSKDESKRQKTANSDQKPKNKLPQTGEKNSIFLVASGVVLLAAVVGYYIFKKKKGN